jgi:hypothetical protein
MYSKNSNVFGKNTNYEPFSKNNNDPITNTKSNVNSIVARVSSKSPVRNNNVATDKKTSSYLSNNSTKKEVAKRTSQPINSTRNSVRKPKDEVIDIIPFGDDNTSKLNFKKKGSTKNNYDNDFVTGLINDGYVEYFR